MTPPETSPYELARCFAELERLGLARPATVSVAEYLAQLARENVLDAETSAIVCDAFNRLRYGSAAPDDIQVRQASERLRASIAAFAAISVKNAAVRWSGCGPDSLRQLQERKKGAVVDLPSRFRTTRNPNQQRCPGRQCRQYSLIA